MAIGYSLPGSFTMAPGGGGGDEVARAKVTVYPALSPNFGTELRSQIDGIGKKLTGVGAGLTAGITAPILAGGAAAYTMARDYEKNLTAIRTQVGLTSSEVATFSHQLLTEGPKWGQPPEVLAKTLYFVASAGYTGAEAMDIVEKSAKGMSIGMGDSTLIADVLTSAIAAYGKETLNAAAANDIMLATVQLGKAEAADLTGAYGKIIPLAAAMGVEFHEVGGALAVMTQRGTGAAEAGTQVRGIIASIIKPTGEAKDLLESYGVSVQDVQKMLGEQGLLHTIRYLNDLVGGDKTKLGTIFGQVEALSGALTILNGDAAQTDAIFQGVKDSTGASEEAYRIWAETSEGKVAIALATLKGFLVELGGRLLPMVADAAVWLKDRLLELQDGWRRIVDADKANEVLRIVGILAAAGPGLMVVGTAIRGISFAMGGLSILTSPIALVIVAIAALGFAIYKLWTENETFREGVITAWNAIRSAVVSAWENWIKPAWETMGRAWDTISAAIARAWHTHIKPAWDDFAATITRLWHEHVVPFVTQAIPWFQMLWDKIQQGIEFIRPYMEQWGRFIVEHIVPILGWLAAEGVRNVEKLALGIEFVWKFIIKPAWDMMVGLITNVIVPGFIFLKDQVVNTWNFWSAVIESAWQNIIKPAWDMIYGFIFNTLVPGFIWLKDRVVETWNFWVGVIRDAWNIHIKPIWDTILGFINNTLIPGFLLLKDKVSEFWTNIVDAVRTAWETVRTTIFDPMVEFITVTLPGHWTTFKDGILKIWEGLKDGISGFWNDILDTAKARVNDLIGLVNSVIDVLNKIPFVKLDHVATLSIGGPVVPRNIPIGAKQGGAVAGGPPGVDTVPAASRWGQRYLLDNGEHILTRSDVAAMGGQGAVYQFRRELHRNSHPFDAIGLAGGGRVGPDNEGLLQGHRDHVHVAMAGHAMSYPNIIGTAQKSGIPFQVGSTFRPGSRGEGGGLDHHSTGRAVDFPGFNQDAFASFWEKTPGVIELIHRTDARDYAIFGGGGGGGGFFNWLASVAGKLAKKALEGVINKLKESLPQGDQIAPSVVRGMGLHVADKALGYFDQMANVMMGGGNPASMAAVEGWIKEASKYVSIESPGALMTLIMRESGGNPEAVNLWDINAQNGIPSKGLMQTIDPTFNRYRHPGLPNNPFDPVANIVAGMNYIHARYGSLSNVQQADPNRPALGYSLGGAVSLFDTGGVWDSGTLGMNLSGQQEMVFTASEARDMVMGSTTIIVKIGDEEFKGYIDSRIDHHSDELTAALTAAD